jgi:multidrug resistance efflux pump
VVKIFAPQPGKVARVEVEEDDRELSAGTVLFRLDDTVAQAQLEEAQAALAVAKAVLQDAEKLPQQHRHQLAAQKSAVDAREAELEGARQKYDQAKRLFDKPSKLTDAETVKMAEALVKTLEAVLRGEREKLAALEATDPQVSVTRARQEVNARTATVHKAEYVLAECTVKTRTAGRVLRVLINEGEAVAPTPQQPAILFCPSGARIVRAEVEQEFAGRVKLGMSAVVEDDTRAGPSWKGKVTHVSDWFTQRRSILMEPLQLNDVRTLECLIELEAPAPPLRIGQRVRVTLGN